MREQCSIENVPLVLGQVSRLSDAIKAEFDLIAARMTWLLSSQAFLIAAFATSLAAADSPHPDYQFVVRYLIYGLPFFGTAVCVLVALAIAAAHKVASRLKDQRDDFLSSVPQILRIDLVSSRDPEHVVGNLPAKVVPWLFAALWAVPIILLPWPPR